jgi:hypothetical protein
VFRRSQWKLHDYSARLAETPDELAAFLQPLAEAGVDAFHCSQRRFWEGEFGTQLNLAGWVRKLTGRPAISVGSVTLRQDLLETIRGEPSEKEGNLDKLFDMMDRGDFDMWPGADHGRRLAGEGSPRRRGRNPGICARGPGQPRLEHDAVCRNRLTVESCSKFKSVERVLGAKPLTLSPNAL